MILPEILTWFVNCKIIEVYAMPWMFHDDWFEQQILHNKIFS